MHRRIRASPSGRGRRRYTGVFLVQHSRIVRMTTSARPAVLVTGRRTASAVRSRSSWAPWLRRRGSLPSARGRRRCNGRRQCPRFGAGRRSSRPICPTRRRAARYCPRRRAVGRVDAVVNNASIFEDDDATTFSYAAMERALARQHRPGRSAGAGPARSDARRKYPPPACVVNLLDQKLWNPNPDYLSLHVVQGGAAVGPRCWRRRSPQGCGSVAWRRRDVAVGTDDGG